MTSTDRLTDFDPGSLRAARESIPESARETLLTELSGHASKATKSFIDRVYFSDDPFR